MRFATPAGNHTILKIGFGIGDHVRDSTGEDLKAVDSSHGLPM
jgi:hypothetical protein